MPEENFTHARRAAVAGRFYPGAAVRLQSDVEAYLETALPLQGAVPKAIIAPHAGYVFSGSIAATAFARLAPAHDRLRRVVLIGPSHYEEFDGIATTEHDAFLTPLGAVRVDTDAVNVARELPAVTLGQSAHGPEHSLEVELPFLQTVLDDFTLVPLLVGHAEVDEVAGVLDALWGGAETVVVVSSDLSHYLDYESAQRKDRATARAIEGLRGDALDAASACGHRAIAGLLQLARRRRLSCHCLDLRNSGDTAGPRDRVVGYGAFAFEELP